MSELPKLTPMFDVANPGARSPLVVDDLNKMGVAKFHATVTHGADPKAVERELLRAFDQVRHGAVRRMYVRPLSARVIAWVVDTYRIARYRLFRQRKAIREIGARIQATT